ncbi:neugrin [Elgaria multicarinata webbii]|uniref:neugrin n=1 Tax=Elgaria multicarinata webbii TaxID=159646 RepID=UPI002FCCC911
MGPGRLPFLRRALARLRESHAEAALPEDAERVLRSQAKAVRARRLRQLMEPAGAPERALTRQAMEQMRYLSREWPDEWPVVRLARGFQVQPEVVRRVLRSRFSPSPERRREQDAQAGGGGGGRGPLASEDTFRLLPASSEGALARLAAPPARAGHAPVAAQRVNRDRGAPGSGANWDGQLASEVELAAAGGPPQRGVVQRGHEFFDSDGNFLYRIPPGAATSKEESQ